MKVRFIKEHPAGIAKGVETDVAPLHALEWEREGYVEILDKQKAKEMEKPSNKMVEPDSDKKKVKGSSTK